MKTHRKLNPVIVSYIKKLLLAGLELTEYVFDEMDDWKRVLGNATHCGGCNNPLHPLDWQCCAECMCPICDSCERCKDCAAHPPPKYADDSCPGCGAAGEGGVCRDCRAGEN